uniref:Uncharacterized protein n=1 Tax=Ditylenchus dipsaci TaxID=166011 RepID=A0A915D7B2_9BILA
MPSDCCVPCPFQPTASSIQPSCCQNPPNNCGSSFQSSHPSEIQLPGGLGTITERDVDEFVDNLLERNLQRQHTKRLGQQSPPQDNNQSNNYEGVYNSKYFAVPSNNQNFHSPPKGFGASISAKSAEKSEDKAVANENQTKKEKFNPNFKFFYQFGDGDLSESKTALYHVNQLKTKQPTVISLRPSTENLLKMLNSQAHGLHMVEVPFEEDPEKDGSEDQNKTVVDKKAA